MITKWESNLGPMQQATLPLIYDSMDRERVRAFIDETLDSAVAEQNKAGQPKAHRERLRAIIDTLLAMRLRLVGTTGEPTNAE